MPYFSPYVVFARDLHELEPGFFVKIGKEIKVITSKVYYRQRKSVTVAANSNLTVQFINADSGTGNTSGTAQFGGFSGNAQMNPPKLNQFKYITFGSPSTAVSLFWNGKQPIPSRGTFTFDGDVTPAAFSQGTTFTPTASPLQLDRWSSETSSYLEGRIANNTGASVVQDFYLYMVEYEYRKVDASDVVTPVIDEITGDGFLIRNVRSA